MAALLLIDVQNDFLPGGPLAVPESNQILPIIDELLDSNFNLTVASQDWHPANHVSFAANHNKQPGETIFLDGLEQMLWPVHCVQNTPGAQLPSHWDHTKIDKIIYKGTNPNIDSYSAFFDNGHRKSTGLAEYLQNKNIRDLYVAGVATDYCVKYSVLDALELGFNVYLIIDACRGVNLQPEDTQNALNEMKQAGAKIIFSHMIKQ